MTGRYKVTRSNFKDMFFSSMNRYVQYKAKLIIQQSLKNKDNIESFTLAHKQTPTKDRTLFQ